jgi:hypothetical protein
MKQALMYIIWTIVAIVIIWAVCTDKIVFIDSDDWGED